MKCFPGGFFCREDGISAIIVALAMTALLAFASLTIDIGMAYSEAAKIQNTADAVALSLGQFLPVGESDNEGIAEIIVKAKEYAIKNGYNGMTDENIIFSDLESGKYKSVCINLSETQKTHLAKIIGVESLTTVKQAKVSVTPVGSMMGCTPIGISANAYSDAVSNGQTEHVVLKGGGGSGETGFFGYIVVDGSNGNAAALLDTFKYGYPGDINVGDTLPTATGNKASVAKDGVDYRMSLCRHYPYQGGCTVARYVEGCPRIMYVMIYDFVDSRTIKVTGFAAIILEYSENTDEIRGSFISLHVPSDSAQGMDCGVYTFRLTN